MTVQLSVLDPVPLSCGQSPHESLRTAIQLAQTAEQSGYRRVWYAEHHLPRAAACPAPAVLVAAVAAATDRIRVGSGGVVLRHHAPLHVAETFSTLAALHPGRIDLGVAGGTGADEQTTRRLGGDGTSYPDRLAALDEALRDLNADVHSWVLGASARSAELAARFGWHYGSGNVTGDPGDVQAYRAQHTARRHATPTVALAVAVVCADTTEAALHLARSHRAYFSAQGMAPGGQPVPPPAALPVTPGPLALYPRLVVGDPVTVRSALTALARRYGADELALLTITHDSQARRHSYALIAEAFAQAAPPPIHLPHQPGGYL